MLNIEGGDELKKGVEEVGNGVKVRVGGKGGNVMMEKKLGGGEIRKDGVSVGKEVELRDGLENRGGEVVK